MLREELEKILDGEVEDNEETLKAYSRDASIFEIKPRIVVYPKHAEDVKRLVRFAAEKKRTGENVSLTVRSGGTDMTGGAVNDSIIVDVARHLNRLKELGDGYAVVEPGMFYRDFERETLKKNLFIPSYPASREICTVGGMVANNAGGEKTLKYGKTQDYVLKLKAVFADGEEYAVQPLTKSELEEKITEKTPDGERYRKLSELIEKHFEAIRKAKPRVSKNSSGYNLWDVWNRETFDLTKLITGSQGTLCIITEITFRLVPKAPESGMAVVFLNDFTRLADIIHAVLPLRPSSVESFDDRTFRYLLKYFSGFLKALGAKNIFSLALKFLPEFWLVLTRGFPQLVMLVEFEEKDASAVQAKLAELKKAMRPFPAGIKTMKNKEESKKYWVMRRESFNVLRQKIKNRKSLPIIDDLIVAPDRLPEFLPKLYELLDRRKLFYAIQGHTGDGNFHVFPLMDISDARVREQIPEIAGDVYRLTLEYGGSLSAEHNDGLIRTPFLSQMFGKEMYRLFEEVKNIFDPQNIFNPKKKVGADITYAMERVRTS